MAVAELDEPNKAALCNGFALPAILGVVNGLLINRFWNQHLAKELRKDSELAAVIKNNQWARVGDDFHELKAI